MLLDDLVFRIERTRTANLDLEPDCFSFYKTRELVALYEKFWSSRTDFQPRNVLELGIWDGGSIAYWFERFHPDKHVAIDISRRGDSEYFRRYLSSRGLEGRIHTFWGTDQGNPEALRAIVLREFRGPLDLVIDDASHIYDLTKTSFETLFPYLRPGGLYIIEDWAWAHWKDFDVPYRWGHLDLSNLVNELVEVVGSSSVIASLVVFGGFAVVEKGEEHETVGATFTLKDHIYRWKAQRGRRVFNTLKRIWKALSSSRQRLGA